MKFEFGDLQMDREIEKNGGREEEKKGEKITQIKNKRSLSTQQNEK